MACKLDFISALGSVHLTHLLNIYTTRLHTTTLKKCLCIIRTTRKNKNIKKKRDSRHLKQETECMTRRQGKTGSGKWQFTRGAGAKISKRGNKRKPNIYKSIDELINEDNLGAVHKRGFMHFLLACSNELLRLHLLRTSWSPYSNRLIITC